MEEEEEEEVFRAVSRARIWFARDTTRWTCWGLWEGSWAAMHFVTNAEISGMRLGGKGDGDMLVWFCSVLRVCLVRCEVVVGFRFDIDLFLI